MNTAHVEYRASTGCMTHRATSLTCLASTWRCHLVPVGSRFPFSLRSS